MHAVRRAVLRSAVTAATPAARTAAPAAFARAAAAPAAVRCSAAALSVAAFRCFSQTVRVANTEDSTHAAEAATTPSSTGDAEAAAGEPTETPYGVFVRNIVFDASEAHLQEAFEHYGPVTKTVIARDARGLSRGYGFIWFQSEDAMSKALQEANGSFWHGRRIVVLPRAARTPREEGGSGSGSGSGGRPAPPKRAPTNSLYVGNLPYETTDADLNVIFRELSGLRAVRVAVDRSTGWPRGFAHADFESVEQASSAYDQLQGKVIGSRTLRIDFANPSKHTASPSGSGSGSSSSSSTPPAESTLRQ